VGNSLAGNIVSQVQERADGIIAQNTAILQSDLQNQITQGVTTKVLEDWASAPHSVSDFLSDKELSNVFQKVDSQFRDYAAAVAAADIAAAKNQLTADIQNRVADAQKSSPRLSRNKSNNPCPLRNPATNGGSIPLSACADRSTSHAGLSLPSKATWADLEQVLESPWQASGTVGINFTRNVFLETGYRYF
jgi:hypothetical protein